LGITQNISNRETTYITGEIRRGEFSYVFEVPLDQMSRAELWLRYDFKSFNVYIDGGTEFYKKSIIPLIITQLKKRNIEARQLSREEIENIKRKEYIKKNMRRLIKTSLNVIVDLANKTLEMKPNPQQEYILKIIIKFFEENNIGKLIWACGLGKALLSILIINLMNFKSIIIGVPGKNLQNHSLFF
jgi:predicted helicase